MAGQCPQGCPESGEEMVTGPRRPGQDTWGLWGGQLPCTGCIASVKPEAGKPARIRATRFLGQWKCPWLTRGDLYELEEP